MKMTKTKIVIPLLCMALCLIGFSGCGKNTVDNEASQEPVAEQKDSTTESVSDTEGKNILEFDREIVEVEYDYLLYDSDTIVKGEITEDLGGKYTNPDGTIPELANAWETEYVLKVDEVYKGDVSEGDEIHVAKWNKIGWPVDAEKNYVIEDDLEEYYLRKGQSGVFMLEYIENEGKYYIMYGKDSVFELKDTGTAAMNEESNEVYAAPRFEMTLDKLPEDIKNADEKYQGAESDDNSI